jgi:hypothetical protein
MEKPIYPLKNLRITQGYQEGTHRNSYAIDNAGLNNEIEDVYAPFSGTIKKIYEEDANEVWLESDNPVEYPDGTIDYMTVLFAHDNDISDLYVGKKVAQGKIFYQEGTKGNAIGNHCHIECGKGKFIEPGWIKNENGYYVIINGKKPEECFWLKKDMNIIDDYGYTFQTLEDNPVEILTPEIKENVTEQESTLDEPLLIYTCTKTGLYGIYLKENEQVFLK